MEIMLNDLKYIVVRDDFAIFSALEIEDKITDYFIPYDYILGDLSYGKLRFKGFYESNNKKCKKLNDISLLKEYIDNYCAYGCKWFLLKKM